MTKAKILFQSDRLVAQEGALPPESNFDKTGKCSAGDCKGKTKPKFSNGWCWYCGEKKPK